MMYKKFRKSIINKVNKILSEGKDVIVYKNTEYKKNNKNDRYIVEEFNGQQILRSVIFLQDGIRVNIGSGKCIYGVEDNWSGHDFLYTKSKGRIEFILNFNYIRKQCKILKERQEKRKSKELELINIINSKSQKELKQILIKIVEKNSYNILFLSEYFKK